MFHSPASGALSSPSRVPMDSVDEHSSSKRLEPVLPAPSDSPGTLMYLRPTGCLVCSQRKLVACGNGQLTHYQNASTISGRPVLAEGIWPKPAARMLHQLVHPCECNESRYQRSTRVSPTQDKLTQELGKDVGNRGATGRAQACPRASSTPLRDVSMIKCGSH